MKPMGGRHCSDCECFGSPIGLGGEGSAFRLVVAETFSFLDFPKLHFFFEHLFEEVGFGSQKACVYEGAEDELVLSFSEFWNAQSSVLPVCVEIRDWCAVFGARDAIEAVSYGCVDVIEGLPCVRVALHVVVQLWDDVLAYGVYDLVDA